MLLDLPAHCVEELLSEADLRLANPSGAKVTDEQLAQARTLEGATLPDGTKHE